MTANLSLHHHLWLPHEGAGHTVVALHGTGGDETDLVPLVQTLYPNANILGLRGNVIEHGYPRFFRRFAEGLFDEDDIRTRTKDLAAFWRAAATQYNLVPETTTWLGYSNGANMVASLLLLEDIVQSAVLLRAQAPFKQALNVTAQPVPAQVKILSGDYDTIVPTSESRRLEDALAARGHTVQHLHLPTGHQLSQLDITALS